MQIGTTLTRFIIGEERQYPEATGKFTGLLTELASAAKIIPRDVNKAGLAEVMGITGRINVHGEKVQRLDEFANSLVIRTTDHTGRLAGLASEEMDDIYPIPDKHPRGNYILVYDPVDGSSNIDVNVSIGTIFSIYRRRTQPGTSPTIEDALQTGSQQLASGYVLYGSSTILVLTTGQGVNAFTYEPSLGEFFLSHTQLRFPEDGKTYSCNEGNFNHFCPRIQAYLETCRVRNFQGRYIGSLVADFHRNLLKGGIYLYPSTQKTPQGKLRLMYECNALALLAEQAGGMASNGTRRILEIEPQSLHQRVPFYIGSPNMVEDVLRHLSN